MTTKLKNVQLYSRRLPKDAARFLVYYGNKLNGQSVSITVLEVWRSTSKVEASFRRQKEAHGWTSAVLGQAALNDKKFVLAQAMHKHFWKTYTSYERCNSFFRESQKVNITNPLPSELQLPGGSTVWDWVHANIKAEVALGNMTASNHDMLFHMANDMFRILRSQHPEYVPLLICMTMPRIAKGWGACALLPEGLPTVAKISTDALNGPLQDMDQSAVVKHIDNEANAEPLLRRRSGRGRGGPFSKGAKQGGRL